MSYSFSVNAPDRAALTAAISAKFDEVVAHQPMHAHDRVHVEKMFGHQMASLGELHEGQCFHASVSGYLSWREGGGDEPELTSFSANVAVCIGTAPTAVTPA